MGNNTGIDRLGDVPQRARQGGGSERVERQHARERIARKPYIYVS